MPIYEYLCPNCDNIEEILTTKVIKNDDKYFCPICRKEMKHILNTFRFELKGKDWYNPGLN